MNEGDFRNAIHDMEDAALWDVRRVVLSSAHRADAVAVRYFEEAVSEGLRSLPRRALEDLWDQLQMQDLGKQTLRTLAASYKPARMLAFEEDDLRRASALYWEGLQVEDGVIREALSVYDYGTAVQRLAAVSSVLNRELLPRLVYVKCPGPNVVEEVVYTISKSTTNELKMMAGKLFERLDKTGGVKQAADKELAHRIPRCASKDQLRGVVRELLRLFPRQPPPPKSEPSGTSAVATVTVSYQGKQRQVAAVVRIERLDPVVEEQVAPSPSSSHPVSNPGGQGTTTTVVLDGPGGRSSPGSIVASVINVRTSKSGAPDSVKSVPVSATKIVPATTSGFMSGRTTPAVSETGERRPTDGGAGAGGRRPGSRGSTGDEVSIGSAKSIPASVRSTPGGAADVFKRDLTAGDDIVFDTASHLGGPKQQQGGGPGSVASLASGLSVPTSLRSPPLSKQGTGEVDLWAKQGTTDGGAGDVRRSAAPSVAVSERTSRSTHAASAPVVQKSREPSEAGGPWVGSGYGNAGAGAARGSSRPASVTGSVAGPIDRPSRTTPASSGGPAARSRPQSELGDEPWAVGAGAGGNNQRPSFNGSAASSRISGTTPPSAAPGIRSRPDSEVDLVANTGISNVVASAGGGGAGGGGGSRQVSVAGSAVSRTSRTTPASAAPVRSRPQSEVGDSWGEDDVVRDLYPTAVGTRGGGGADGISRDASIGGGSAVSGNRTSRTSPASAAAPAVARPRPQSEMGEPWGNTTTPAAAAPGAAASGNSQPTSMAGSTRSSFARNTPGSSTLANKGAKAPSEADDWRDNESSARDGGAEEAGSDDARSGARSARSSRSGMSGVSADKTKPGSGYGASKPALPHESGSLKGSISFAQSPRASLTNPGASKLKPEPSESGDADSAASGAGGGASRPGSAAGSVAGSSTRSSRLSSRPPAAPAAVPEAREGEEEEESYKRPGPHTSLDAPGAGRKGPGSFNGSLGGSEASGSTLSSSVPQSEASSEVLAAAKEFERARSGGSRASSQASSRRLGGSLSSSSRRP